MIALLLNHLWQSSLCMAGAGLLALALRRNGANVRFWLWFAASIKFLVPFALLTVLGAYVLTPIVPPPVVPAAIVAMKPLAKPFSPTGMALTQPTAGPSDAPALILTAEKPAPARPGLARLDLASVALALWLAGFLIILLHWLVRWSRVHALLRDAAPVPVDAPIAVKFSSSRLEPGLVGILRPVILLPAGIERQLSQAEFKAVLAHELCHWRRRDNLLAAVHMLVEALFWFFPLVWWLGARLNAERERACDESVLAEGNDPQLYAEGILKVCRAYLQSPLACVAGISGAGLKQRIDQIMENRLIPRLNAMRKLALSASAILVLVPPLLLGISVVPVAQLQAKASAMVQKSAAAIASVARNQGGNSPNPANALSSQSDAIAKAGTPPPPLPTESQTVLASAAPPAPAPEAAPAIQSATPADIARPVAASAEADSSSADAPHPKTEPGLRCLLGLWPTGCERLFEHPSVTRRVVKNCIGSNSCNGGGGEFDGGFGPLENIEYLGPNAAGNDVYSVKFRNAQQTYVLPLPGPNGKIATRCIFDRPPAGAMFGACQGAERILRSFVDAGAIPASYAQVTSPANPPRILYTRRAEETATRPDTSRPKTEAGIICLLGLGSNGCEVVFENPARQAITYCAGQYAGSGGSVGADGGLYGGRCADGPLESIEYLGVNAAGDDVYLARFQNKNFTYILPPPGPDGKIATHYAFDRSPGGVGSSAQVTAPAGPPQILYTRPAEWK